MSKRFDLLSWVIFIGLGVGLVFAGFPGALYNFKHGFGGFGGFFWGEAVFVSHCVDNVGFGEGAGFVHDRSLLSL